MNYKITQLTLSAETFNNWFDQRKSEHNVTFENILGKLNLNNSLSSVNSNFYSCKAHPSKQKKIWCCFWQLLHCIWIAGVSLLRTLVSRHSGKGVLWSYSCYGLSAYSYLGLCLGPLSHKGSYSYPLENAVDN